MCFTSHRQYIIQKHPVEISRHVNEWKYTVKFLLPKKIRKWNWKWKRRRTEEMIFLLIDLTAENKHERQKLKKKSQQKSKKKKNIVKWHFPSYFLRLLNRKREKKNDENVENIEWKGQMCFLTGKIPFHLCTIWLNWEHVNPYYSYMITLLFVENLSLLGRKYLSDAMHLYCSNLFWNWNKTQFYQFIVLSFSAFIFLSIYFSSCVNLFAI